MPASARSSPAAGSTCPGREPHPPDNIPRCTRSRGNRRITRWVDEAILESIVERVRAEQLPGAWCSSPPLLELRKPGDPWIESQRSVVLEAPSAVLPIERDYFFNPAQADFKRVRVKEPQAFNSDPGLVGLGG